MKSTLKLLKAFLCLLFILFISNEIYSQSGALDMSFGTGGKITTDFNHTDDVGTTITLQEDGKILVAGYTNKTERTSDFAVIRYLVNGNPDSSFGSDGKTIISFNSYAFCEAIVLQSDNKIILAGYEDGSLALVRLNSNGLFDSSFGINGIVIKSAIYNEALSVVLQKDKKIVTAGVGHSDRYYYVTNAITINRFNENGSIDSSFGDNGEASTVFGDQDGFGEDESMASSIVMQDDGKLVAGGYTDVQGSKQGNYVALVRFNTNGIIDSSFGINGKDSVFVGSLYGFKLPLSLQEDQKIIASSFTKMGSNNAFVLLRFNKNGGLDSSFGTNGMTITKIANSNQNSYGFDNPYAVSVEKDGKIIQAGVTSNGSNLDFAVTKYNTSGFLDSTYGVNGITTTDFDNSDDYALAMTIQPDSKVVVAGYMFNGSGSDFAVARYNNDNLLPVTFISFTATKQTQSVLLDWQTADEINNNYFSIERSNDNKHFNEINKVYGFNRSFKINSYSTTDLKPLQGWNYYRLKQVDKDGKFTYSNIVSIDFTNNASAFAVFPNPAGNNANITIPASNSVSQIVLYDGSGKTLMYKEVAANETSYQLEINNLASGAYNVVLIQNGKQQSIKLVKK